MSRNKTAILLLLCLLVCLGRVMAESESLISDEMIQEQTVNYSKTAVVQRGTYEKKATTSCSEYYPYTYSLRCELSNAKFVEYRVERRSEVKAGDVLAVFSVPTDPVELESRRLSLNRAQENYESGKLQRQETLEEMTRQHATASPQERELLALKLRRLKVELEQYCYQQECALADQEKVIAELEEEQNRSVLISPVDGIVTDVVYKREGERVRLNEKLITVARTDGMLMRIKNQSNDFRYGARVTVEVGPNKSRTALTGTVVSACNMLPENRRSDYAYIELDPYEEGLKLTRPSASYCSIYLENVLTIPRRALSLDSGMLYVEKAEGGVARKRFVNQAAQSVSTSWILQGLEEGDIIIND